MPHLVSMPRQPAANTTLLNCYLREGGTASFTGDRVRFPALGVEAEVTHRSAVLHHRFAGVGVEPVEAGAPNLRPTSIQAPRTARCSHGSRPASPACAPTSRRATSSRLWTSEFPVVHRDRTGAGPRPPAAPHAQGPVGQARGRTRRSSSRISSCIGCASTPSGSCVTRRSGTSCFGEGLLPGAPVGGRLPRPRVPRPVRGPRPVRRSRDAHLVGAHRLPRGLAVSAEVLAPRAGHELDARHPAQGAAAGGRGQAAERVHPAGGADRLATTSRTSRCPSTTGSACSSARTASRATSAR